MERQSIQECKNKTKQTNHPADHMRLKAKQKMAVSPIKDDRERAQGS